MTKTFCTREYLIESLRIIHSPNKMIRENTKHFSRSIVESSPLTNISNNQPLPSLKNTSSNLKVPLRRYPAKCSRSIVLMRKVFEQNFFDTEISVNSVLTKFFPIFRHIGEGRKDQKTATVPFSSLNFAFGGKRVRAILLDF